MATNDVINALVRDLEPVSPLPLRHVRLRRWMRALVAVGAAAVAVLGRRGDLSTTMFAQPFQAHVAFLVLAAVSSAAAALALAIPGETVGRWRRAGPAIAVGAWLAWLAGELMPLAAAAVGALGVELTCPLNGPMHLLLWHAGPVMVVVLLAALFGRAGFSAVAAGQAARRP